MVCPQSIDGNKDNIIGIVASKMVEITPFGNEKDNYDENQNKGRDENENFFLFHI
jgi:hypothetical protein